MKSTILTGMLTLSLVLATGTVKAQMGGPGMMSDRQGQPETSQEQPDEYPYMGYPGMMGRYSYGMGPGMMGPGYGYGMGYGGGYGPCPLCRGYQGPQFSSPEEYSKFLDATREKRKKLNNLMFEYDEEQFSSEPDQQKLKKLAQEIDTLRSEIFNYEVK